MEILGLVDVPVSLALAVLAVTLLYIYSSWNHSFFVKRGIPGPKPYPFIGHMSGVAVFSKFEGWRKTYGNIYGIFAGQEPMYVISDFGLLKEIFVKSFSNFRDRRKFGLLSYPFNLGLFFLEGEAWRRVRNILSPTFSSGKLRGMVTSINDCARLLTENFKKQDKSTDGVDTKDHFGAYTMDVISRTAFGIEVDSQNDLNHPFVTKAKLFFQPSSGARPLILLVAIFPFLLKVVKKLGLSLFRKDIMDYFVNSITEMIQLRRALPVEERKNKIDFLQLLIDAEITEDGDGAIKLATGNAKENETKRQLTTDEIIGQGLLFFIAGYETTASTLNFAAYSLATNPDVQEKAYKEIIEVMGDDEPNYDNIGKLKYLENIILETLRMYPPVTSLSRRAAETITIGGVTIDKKQTVFIPILALQRDPNVYTDPMEFKPERHEDSANSISFLSFGYGPRNCIGMRLALIELKIGLIHVLKHVKFEPLPDTPKVLTFKKLNLLAPEKILRLKVTTR